MHLKRYEDNHRDFHVVIYILCFQFYDDMGNNPSAIPIGFSGRPEHIAKAIAFLADRDSSEYIIGQNIIADGGTSLVLGIHSQISHPKK